VQGLHRRRGRPFIGSKQGGEVAGGVEWPAVVWFKDSRLEGVGYQGVEEGGALFNGGSGRGVKRRRLACQAAVGRARSGGMLPASGGGLAYRIRKKRCRGGPAIGPKAEWAGSMLTVLKRK
jgi:hypothetical protein